MWSFTPHKHTNYQQENWLKIAEKVAAIVTTSSRAIIALKRDVSYCSEHTHSWAHSGMLRFFRYINYWEGNALWHSRPRQRKWRGLARRVIGLLGGKQRQIIHNARWINAQMGKPPSSRSATKEERQLSTRLTEVKDLNPASLLW